MRKGKRREWGRGRVRDRRVGGEERKRSGVCIRESEREREGGSKRE